MSDTEEMSDTIRITATLTQEGYRSLLLHLSALRLRLVAPLLAFFGFAALGAGFNSQGTVAFVVLVAIFITVWGYITWLTSSPRTTELYLPVVYEFSPDGIVFTGQAGEGSLEWQQVKRWNLRAGHYQLYVAGASYLLIPQDDIEGPSISRFEELLRQHVSKGPRKRSTTR